MAKRRGPERVRPSGAARPAGTRPCVPSGDVPCGGSGHGRPGREQELRPPDTEPVAAESLKPVPRAVFWREPPSQPPPTVRTGLGDGPHHRHSKDASLAGSGRAFTPTAQRDAAGSGPPPALGGARRAGSAAKAHSPASRGRPALGPPAQPAPTQAPASTPPPGPDAGDAAAARLGIKPKSRTPARCPRRSPREEPGQNQEADDPHLRQHSAEEEEEKRKLPLRGRGRLPRSPEPRPPPRKGGRGEPESARGGSGAEHPAWG
ncbi:PREDICTED: basic salivary proline-rich protein 3-like [Condylura cristata]|uniref:basic salivary proline-rich protein 3-like n=1 Tax=Condylura cristata TaxID=143302 RepID=UPI0006433C7D|nr:PREDICTED: basic salivary proline-rich protein 3-like [Condylura cristata]